MSYGTNILSLLQDSNKWPTFSREEFLDELNRLADQAHEQGSIEGYLASLLIYHQISEEMTKLLIRCSDFLIQLSVFPMEIKSNKNLDDKMFGQLIGILESGILIHGMNDFISESKRLNTLRIRMVHKIAKKTSLEDIKNQTREVKLNFDNIYRIFEQIYDSYRVTFHQYKKNINDMRECLD